MCRLSQPSLRNCATSPQEQVFRSSDCGNSRFYASALNGCFLDRTADAILTPISDKGIASRAGADEVLLTTGNLAEGVRALAPDGVNHIVEVAFGANIKTDTELLAQGGSIATYATNTPMPETPVWQLVFVNARLFFVGSDDVPAEAKIDATRDINKALEAGWQGLDIAEIVPLDQIARAHELVEHPAKPGRVIVSIR